MELKLDSYNQPINQSFFDTLSNLLIFSQVPLNLDYLFKILHPRILQMSSKDFEDIDKLEKRYQDEIYEECKDNIYFFLKDIMRIPVQGGGSIKYKLDIANLAEINFANSSRIGVWKQKPRQTMSSLSTYCLMIYERIFRHRKFVLICKNRSDIKLQSKRINDLINLIPKFILNRSHIPSYDYFDYFFIESDEQAYNLANYCIDKGINIVVNDGEFVDHLYPLIIRYISRNIINGDNFRSFLSVNSTINNTEKGDNRLFKLLDNIHVPHVKALYDNDYNDNRSNIGIAKLHFKYEDLGFDQEWYDNMCKMLNNDKEIIESEILLIRKNDYLII